MELSSKNKSTAIKPEDDEYQGYTSFGGSSSGKEGGWRRPTQEMEQRVQTELV